MDVQINNKSIWYKLQIALPPININGEHKAISVMTESCKCTPDFINNIGKDLVTLERAVGYRVLYSYANVSWYYHNYGHYVPTNYPKESFLTT